MTRISLLTLVLLTAIAPIVWGSTYIVTSELLPTNSPLTASMLISSIVCFLPRLIFREGWLH